MHKYHLCTMARAVLLVLAVFVASSAPFTIAPPATSAPPPVKCEARDDACCKPIDLVNGKIAVPETPRVGAAAIFTCDPYYRVKGDIGGSRVRTLICTSGNRWNHAVPSCELYACEVPEIKNGYVAGLKPHVSVNDQATVICKGGYVVDGSPTVRCLPGNRWAREFPQCREIYWDWCEKPPHPENGGVTVAAKTPPNGIATFSCKPGFTLYGSTDMRCERGNWKYDDDLPYCSNRGELEENLRPYYDLPQKNPDTTTTEATTPTTTTTTTTPKTTTTTTAKATTTTTTSRPTTTTTQPPTTTINRKWRDPKRDGYTCYEPYLENGEVLYNSLMVGTRAVFVCDDGYTRRGPKILRCNENKSWVGGETPICV